MFRIINRVVIIRRRVDWDMFVGGFINRYFQWLIENLINFARIKLAMRLSNRKSHACTVHRGGNTLEKHEWITGATQTHPNVLQITTDFAKTIYLLPVAVPHLKRNWTNQAPFETCNLLGKNRSLLTTLKIHRWEKSRVWLHVMRSQWECDGTKCDAVLARAIGKSDETPYGRCQIAGCQFVYIPLNVIINFYIQNVTIFTYIFLNWAGHKYRNFDF